MIASFAWLCGWLTLIVMAEVTLLMRWGWWCSACQLGLVTVLGIGLWRRPSEALVAGLWGGLLVDDLTASSCGASTLLFALVAWGTTRLRRHLYKDHPLVQMVLAGVVVMIGGIVGWYVAAVGGGGAGWLGRWIWHAAPTALVTAVAAPLWLRAIRPIVVRGW